MKITLTIKKGTQEPEVIQIDHFPFVIGRSKESDWVLSDSHISRRHVKIDQTTDGLFIINLSKKGTLLINGKPIEKEKLTLPCTFEIPPFQCTLESEIIEALAPEAEPEDIFPMTLDEEAAPVETSNDTKISTHRPKAKIIVLKGISPHPSYDLIGDEIIIGRDPECDIVLEDSKVSREHAHIFIRDNRYYIKDIGSVNATVINQTVLTKEQPLSSGDQLKLGDVVLQFALFDESANVLISDSTQTAIMSTDNLPHFEPDQTPVISQYYHSKSVKGLFAKYKKIFYATSGLLLLFLVFLTLNQKEEPQRDTARERTALRQDISGQERNQLSKLLKEDRKYVLAKMQDAKDLIKNRRYTEAQIVLQEIFAIAPGYKKARALEGTIRYTLDQQAQSERRRQAQLEEKKLEEQIKYHLSVALDYFNRQQWQKAVSEYDKILELHPDHQEAHRRKSLAQQKIQGLPQIPKVSSSKQKNREAEKRLAKGSQLSRKGNINEALKVWRSILKMEGINPTYYMKADKFIQFSKKQLHEKYLPLMTQAQALIEAGEHTQAQKILESILKEQPSYTAAKEALQKVHNALHQRARRQYTEAVIEENVGRIDEAILKFKWIVERIPASDEYHRKAKKKLNKYE